MAFDQRPLAGLALGDVAHQRHGEPLALLRNGRRRTSTGKVEPSLRRWRESNATTSPLLEPRGDLAAEVGLDVDLRRAHAHQFLARVAEALAGLTVHVQDGAAAAVQEERVGGVIHEGAEASLAGPQLRLGVPEVGDVLHGAEDPARHAGGALGDVALAVDDAHLPVGVDDAVLDVVARAASQRFGQGVRGALPIVGVDDRAPLRVPTGEVALDGT